jgi:hypothetical protein
MDSLCGFALPARKTIQLVPGQNGHLMSGSYLTDEYLESAYRSDGK